MFVYVDGVAAWNLLGSPFYWIFCRHTEIDEYLGFLPDGVRGAWWAVWLMKCEYSNTAPHYQYQWTFDNFALLEEGKAPLMKREPEQLLIF